GRDAASVHWGLWASAPLDDDGFARVAATGAVPMAAPDALATVDLMTCGDVVVLAADVPRLRAVADALGAGPLLSEVLDGAGCEPAASLAEHGAPQDDPAPRADQAPPAQTAPSSPAVASAPAGAGDVLRAHLAQALGLPTPDDIDTDTPLVALGLDSLQALELRTAVRAELGRDLPLEAVLGGATLADVTAALAD
ncbi:acyl carrier protein, partial [Tsukamurella soli]